jgi:YVTN family beta-propeller protein
MTVSRRGRMVFAALVAVAIVAVGIWIAQARPRHATAANAGSPDAGPGGPSGSSMAMPSMSMAMPSMSPTKPKGASSSASPSATNVYAGIDTTVLPPVVRHDHPYVYVPNGIPGTVKVIDPTTFKVVRTISFGYRTYPEHVSPSYDMRHLYADVDGSSALGVIDPRTGKLTGMIHGVDRPYNLYFTPDGSRAIDVAEYENKLNFMDPRTWKLIKSVQMPCNGADHMDFGPPGTTYLLISCEYDGQIIKVDWRTMRVLGTLNVGGMPIDVKLVPDGTRFLVANQGLSGVSVIDPRSMHAVRLIHTGNGAHGMAIARDTRSVYVTNRLAGSISRINFASLKVTATWQVGGSPDMAQVSPDGTQLWVSNRFGTTVSVIDTSNGHVLHRIQVGKDPHGLTYFPQPGNYSLGHNGVYR